MNPIYVFGHKNPDTDSIVSAIAYAEYKNKKGFYAIPARLGSINSETEFLLEKFGFEDPIRLFSARSTLNEIELDKISLVSKNISMKNALEKTLKTKNKALMVGDKKGYLEGIVSLDDLTYMWTKTDKELENIIKHIKINNIVNILKGKLVIQGNRKLSGKLHIFPGLKSNVEKGSIILSRNEDDKIKYCLDRGAALIIVVTSSPISDITNSIAQTNGATIVTTDLSPLSVTRLIYQTPTIEYVMAKKEKVVYFEASDTVQDATKKIMNSRHRSYPVLDEDGKVIGGLSRYHLLNYEKKKMILVDHNEYKQSIDNIEDGEIIEIIDHHRFGGFKCDNPINIITKTYGSTATIISCLFFDNNIALTKKLAGLLLGAIISDTMNFNSPTTTEVDRKVAKKLEKISGVDPDKLSKEMIDHSDSILSRRFIEVVYDDFKEYKINDVKVGLSQAQCRSKEEFLMINKGLQNYLEDASKSGSYDLMMIMLTNPNGSGSYLLSAGSKKNVLKQMYDTKENFVKGLLSRKKQLLPKLITTLGDK